MGKNSPIIVLLSPLFFSLFFTALAVFVSLYLSLSLSLLPLSPTLPITIHSPSYNHLPSPSPLFFPLLTNPQTFPLTTPKENMEAPNQVQVEDETGIDRSLDDIMIMDPKDPESRTNETCRDYQRGYCPRGERCWFRHEGAPPSIDTELLAPGVVATLGGRALCRDYMRNHCRRGVECPYFHCRGGERCRDFDRMQDCRRGILCPFLHVSIQPRTTTTTGSPGALMSSVKPPGSPYYREGGRTQFDPYSRPIPKQSFGDFKPPIVKTELCRDWSRFNGDCPRGASCQYLHGNPGDICRDFSRRGRCFRGDACPFTHQIAAESKPELCMKFQKGECNRGQACPYIHAHRSPNGAGQPEVCRKFLRGQCDRGANCNYFHPMEEAKRDYPEADFN